MDFQKLNKIIMLNKTKAFSLVEVLVSMIVGSLMVAAIYFAYGVFSKTYLTTIQKISVNKNIRAGLSAISKDLRMASYYMPLTSSQTGYVTSLLGSITTPIRIINNTNAPQAIDIIYDSEDRLLNNFSRIKITYSIDSNQDLVKSLLRCLDANCANTVAPDNLRYFQSQKIAGPCEDLQFILMETNSGIKQITEDVAKVRNIYVNLLCTSTESMGFQGKTYNTGIPGVGGGRILPNLNDGKYRDMMSVIVYPRNILKPGI
jgi:prepilin-type N-terminal cleavage/methylation domain-containing protein